MKKEFVASSLTARLVVTGLLCWVLAGTAYAVLRLTFGDRPVGIHVRWAPTVDDAARFQLEQRYQLARAVPMGDRTFGYALTDRSRDNIRNLVLDPAVEDTHEIDRTAFRVGDAARRLPYVTPSPGIPVGLQFLAIIGFLGGLASIGLALLAQVACSVAVLLAGRSGGTAFDPLVALVALPPLLAATAWVAVMAIVDITGRDPIWNLQPRNLAEAAAFRDTRAVVRSIDAGEDPDRPGEVRAGVILPASATLTPVEAAAVSGHAEMLQLLIDLGASLDANAWQRVWCIATESEVRSFLASYRPTGAMEDCVEP